MCWLESFLPRIMISLSVSVNTFRPNCTHTFVGGISSLVISSTITGLGEIVGKLFASWMQVVYLLIP